MNKYITVLSDLFGIARVLGLSYSVKWLWKCVANFRWILKNKNLSIADNLMGEGPFQVQYSSGICFAIKGREAFSGIREMYVRDVYLRGGKLSINDGDLVLDLGANMGNFTNLALAHGSHVRVVAVEPNQESNEAFERSVSLNLNFRKRVALVRGFVGGMGAKQLTLQAENDYKGAAALSENTLLQSNNIETIDFLKCDIEGGEFELLHPKSQILMITKKIAIEVHQFAGDVNAFINMLKTVGFKLVYIQHDTDGSVTVLGSRQ